MGVEDAGRVDRRTFLSAVASSSIAASGCLSQVTNEQESTPRIRKILIQNAGENPHTVQIRVTVGDTDILSESYQVEVEGEKLITGSEIETGSDNRSGSVSITADLGEEDTEREMTLSEAGCFNVLIEVTDSAPILYSGRAPEQRPCEVE